MAREAGGAERRPRAAHLRRHSLRRLTAELAADVRARLGEGPVWHDGTLHWLDLLGRALHRTTPSGATETTALPEQVGAIAPSAAYGLVAASESGFAALAADGTLTRLASAGLPAPGMRFNDGTCDRAGRFWASTMEASGEPGRGTLWVLDPDLSARPVLTGLAIGNGLAWTADDRTFYFVDTPTRRIDAFDHADGALSNRRTFALVDGHPDGMAIDAEDCLWVALFGGGAVHRYTPDGTLDTVVEVPARQVTSCAFGAGGDLWITTAWDGLAGPDREQHAGSLFRAETGTSGPAVSPFGA